MNFLSKNNIDELFEFLRIPSISAQREHAGDVCKCAEWLAGRFRARGLDVILDIAEPRPVVIASSPRDTSRKTVLFYGHYDVQPPEPLDEWSSPPFEPTVRDGRIFARGVSDNKGAIMAMLQGIGDDVAALPCNVIFLIEGEEEIGSVALPAALLKYREALRCDVAVGMDTGMVAPYHPTLTYALRGMAAMELRVKGPSHDLHSGVFGGAVMNPATALARMVAQLHDDHGRVMIPGFYDTVKPLDPWERKAAASLPCDDETFRKLTGAPELFGEEGYTTVERVGARPTAEINGLGGGYQGEGSKTVLPREAFAKITFRMVADQKGDDVLARAKKFFEERVPRGVTCDVKVGSFGNPYSYNPRSPYGVAVCRALEKTFGTTPALVREGGSIPVLAQIRDTLGCDILLAGLSDPDASAHAPNENFPVKNFHAGIRLTRAILEEVAS